MLSKSETQRRLRRIRGFCLTLAQNPLWKFFHLLNKSWFKTLQTTTDFLKAAGMYDLLDKEDLTLEETQLVLEESMEGNWPPEGYTLTQDSTAPAGPPQDPPPLDLPPDLPPPPDPPKAQEPKRWLKLWHPKDPKKPFGYIGVDHVVHGPRFYPEDLSASVRERFDRIVTERANHLDNQGRIWLDMPSVYVTCVVDETGFARHIELDATRDTIQPDPQPRPTSATSAKPPPSQEASLPPIGQLPRREPVSAQTEPSVAAQPVTPLPNVPVSVPSESILDLSRLEAATGEISKAIKDLVPVVTDGLKQVSKRASGKRKSGHAKPIDWVSVAVLTMSGVAAAVLVFMLGRLSV